MLEAVHGYPRALGKTFEEFFKRPKHTGRTEFLKEIACCIDNAGFSKGKSIPKTFMNMVLPIWTAIRGKNRFSTSFKPKYWYRFVSNFHFHTWTAGYCLWYRPAPWANPFCLWRRPTMQISSWPSAKISNPRELLRSSKLILVCLLEFWNEFEIIRSWIWWIEADWE